MLNPKHSAFPQSLPSKDSEPLLGSGHDPRTGVDIRTWMATTVMAGIQANQGVDVTWEQAAVCAVTCADALIIELNRTRTS